VSFLNRFESTDSDSGDNAVHAVLKNIRNILNTKRNYGSILPDFGISDLSHCSSRDALVEILSEQIKTVIQTYEPRVSNIEVESLPNVRASQVSLLLRCQLKTGTTSFDLIFDTARTSVSVEQSGTQA
jgi:type VI secretion system lysozyme-like protein